VCSGVTDGTVVTVAVLHAAPGRWQQMKEQAEQLLLGCCLACNIIWLLLGLLDLFHLLPAT